MQAQVFGIVHPPFSALTAHTLKELFQQLKKMKNKKFSYILWDWNGTLLDDAEAGVSVINEMLLKRGMKTLSGRDEYRKAFRFPVSDYYIKIGFDFGKESFEELSVEYVNAYNRREPKLFDGVKETLEAVRAKHISQLILSASEGKSLKRKIKSMGLDGFFSDYLTLNNIYAGGKIHLARAWLNENKIDPGTVLIVGDTLHDLDAAHALGCSCILVSGGHQDLSSAPHGTVIVNGVAKVLDYI